METREVCQILFFSQRAAGVTFLYKFWANARVLRVPLYSGGSGRPRSRHVVLEDAIHRRLVKVEVVVRVTGQKNPGARLVLPALVGAAVSIISLLHQSADLNPKY